MANRMKVVLVLWAGLFLFALTGCAKVKARLSDGTEIACEMYEHDYCGYEFYRCDDGKTYKCQTNFTWEKK